MNHNFSRSSDLAVDARRVSKFFGDVVALDEVDLQVQRGRIHGIVGPNGAGKTTLLGLILGLAAVSEGELDVLGARAASTLGVPMGVNGFVDAPGLYPMLTARENLRQLARLHRLEEPAEVISETLELVGLSDVADDKVRGFSLGMRQRLGLASALVTRPQLLVMDEPSNGLDPAGRLQVQRVLTEHASRGGSVVLSSHRMDDLSQLCDEVTLLSRGCVVFDGSVARLASESPVVDHRVVTNDAVAARRIAATVAGLVVVEAPRPMPDEVVVRGETALLDEYVRRVVGQGLALREFAPVMPPLEAAFLRLTGASELVGRIDHLAVEDAA